MTRTPTLRATMACAQWLQTCLQLGWRKEDLDFLDRLWWRYHDDRGNLVGPQEIGDELNEQIPRAGQ